MSTIASHNVNLGRENEPGKVLPGKLRDQVGISKTYVKERAILGSLQNKEITADTANLNIGGAKKKIVPTVNGIVQKSNYKDIKAKVNTNILAKKSIVSNRPNVLRRQESTLGHAKKAAAEIIVRDESKLKVNELEKKISAKVEQQVAVVEEESVEVLPIDSKEVVDIDEDDGGTLILVSEYVNDIYAYLLQVEQKHPIRENFLEGQEVTHHMRSILIDWLIEVHTQFHLLLETLHITVATIDRYLQFDKTTTRKTLQLVGVAAMLIACKFEEVWAPDIADFVYIVDKSYTSKEILAMEYHILKTLNFELSRPLPLNFLRRYSKAGFAQPLHHTLSKFFIELAFVEYSMCHYHPSELAAAAFCLSATLVQGKKIANFRPETAWVPTLVHYSTYSFKHIEPIVYKLADIVVKKEASSQKSAIFLKYQSSQNMRVSIRGEIKCNFLKELAAKSKRFL